MKRQHKQPRTNRRPGSLHDRAFKKAVEREKNPAPQTGSGTVKEHNALAYAQQFKGRKTHRQALVNAAYALKCALRREQRRRAAQARPEESAPQTPEPRSTDT